jgi:hypothetical protein
MVYTEGRNVSAQTGGMAELYVTFSPKFDHLLLTVPTGLWRQVKVTLTPFHSLKRVQVSWFRKERGFESHSHHFVFLDEIFEAFDVLDHPESVWR